MQAQNPMRNQSGDLSSADEIVLLFLNSRFWAFERISTDRARKRPWQKASLFPTK